MKIKFFAIGLAFVLPLLAISQTTTSTAQKPQQPPQKPATQQVKPTAVPATPQATRPAGQQVAQPATQQAKPVSAAQQAARQVDGADATATTRERFGLEEPERGGGHPYRELLNRREPMQARHFSDRELEPRLLSTLLWEVTGGQNPDDADAAEVAAITGADGTTAAAGRQANPSSVLDVYVLTREYIALYKHNEQMLEIIAKIDDESNLRRTILGKNMFAERAPLILIYVSSNKKLSQIPLNKRDFYAAMDCGMAVQSANLFCASEHLVTTTIEVDPVAVGKILGLKMDKVLLAQPIGYR